VSEDQQFLRMGAAGDGDGDGASVTPIGRAARAWMLAVWGGGGAAGREDKSERGVARARARMHEGLASLGGVHEGLGGSEVSAASDTGGAEAQGGAAEGGGSVMVRGLAAATSKAALAEALGRYGTVLHVTRSVAGFAYVAFDSARAARAALHSRYVLCDGLRGEVVPMPPGADPRGLGGPVCVVPGAGDGEGGQGGAGGGEERYCPGEAVQVQRFVETEHTFGGGMKPARVTVESRTVHADADGRLPRVEWGGAAAAAVHGLPRTATEARVRRAFEHCGALDGVEVPPPTPTPPWY